MVFFILFLPRYTLIPEGCLKAKLLLLARASNYLMNRRIKILTQKQLKLEGNFIDVILMFSEENH